MTSYSGSGIKPPPPNVDNDTCCFIYRTNKSSFVVALLQHPAWLLDENLIPTIRIGTLAFPAPVIPVLLAAAFLYWKITTRIVRRRSGAAGNEAVPRRRGDRHRHGDIGNGWDMKKMIYMFHAYVTESTFMHFGRSLLPRDVLACCQVAAILFHGEAIRPGARKSCLAGALGWCLISFLETAPAGAAVPLLCAVVGFAAPSAWQVGSIRGSMWLEQSASGTLLMLLAGTRGLVFFNQDEAEVWVRANCGKACLALACLKGFNGLIMLRLNRSSGTGRVANDSSGWTIEDATGKVKWFVAALARLVTLLASLLGPLVGGVLCTAFLSSCLPWGSLLFHKCATPPSFSTPSLLIGGFLYVSLWSIWRFVEAFANARHANKGLRDLLRDEVVISSDLIGWSCVLLILLWAAAPGMLLMCQWLEEK